MIAGRGDVHGIGKAVVNVDAPAPRPVASKPKRRKLPIKGTDAFTQSATLRTKPERTARSMHVAQHRWSTKPGELARAQLTKIDGAKTVRVRKTGTEKADDLVKRANEKLKKGDLAGARDDFMEALMYDPGHSAAQLGVRRVSVAYGKRGIKKYKAGNIVGAKGDLEEAVILDPNNKVASYYLSLIKSKQAKRS